MTNTKNNTTAIEIKVGGKDVSLFEVWKHDGDLHAISGYILKIGSDSYNLSNDFYKDFEPLRVPSFRDAEITPELIDSKRGEVLLLNRARALAYNAWIQTQHIVYYDKVTTHTDPAIRNAAISTLAFWLYNLAYVPEVHEKYLAVVHSAPLAHTYDEKIAWMLAAYEHTTYAKYWDARRTAVADTEKASIPRFFGDRSVLEKAFLKEDTADSFTEWLTAPKQENSTSKRAAVAKLNSAIVSGWTAGALCNPLSRTPVDDHAMELFSESGMRALTRTRGRVARKANNKTAFADTVDLYVVAVLQASKADRTRLEAFESAQPECTIETVVQTAEEAEADKIKAEKPKCSKAGKVGGITRAKNATPETTPVESTETPKNQ